MTLNILLFKSNESMAWDVIKHYNLMKSQILDIVLTIIQTLRPEKR